MCNILVLKKGVMPIKSDFINMCHNNWHSYGLVTLIDGKMDITRHVPENGEIDPEAVWKLIERDVEFERILHVRHTTAGLTNLENCHPFDVFYQQKQDSERQVVFMHNGTMYEYKSKKYVQNGTSASYVDDDSGPSDTQNFVTRVLTPMLSSMDLGNGKGDISHPFLKLTLNKFWPVSGNRGILIANDAPPLILGEWKKIKGENGEEILSANDDYFKDVIRGPEKARRDAQKEADKKVTSFRSSTASNVVPLTQFDFKATHGVFTLTESLKNVIDDWEIWDRAHAVALGAATQDELEAVYESGKKNCTILMDWIFTDYAATYGELLDMEEKAKRQEGHIASMSDELKELRQLVKDAGLYKKDVA